MRLKDNVALVTGAAQGIGAAIARALAANPRIILLDEPNAHLDIAHQVDVFRLLRTLNRESGVTVVSVSHDLNLAATYSDRIAMVSGGHLEAIGPSAEVLSSDLIERVFGTRVHVDTHPAGEFPRVTLLPSGEGLQ